MSARDPAGQQTPQSRAGGVLSLFGSLIVGSVFLVAFGLVLLVLLGVSGPILTSLEPVLGGVSDASSGDVISPLGDGFMLLAVSALAVPSSFVLALFLAGKLRSAGPARREPPGPF